MIGPKYVASRPEYKLVFFLAYIAALLITWIAGYGLAKVIAIHLLFVLVFSVYYFGLQFLLILIAPVFALTLPVQTYLVRRYLRQFSQNKPARVAVVLGHPDWTKLEAWVKPIFSKGEIKALIRYLRAKGQDFSFYPEASIRDVEQIMRDERVKEVYFFGHGNAHSFQLGTEEILYYCDFGGAAYTKDFVHQVHCGDPHGKSLVDYVVPETNRAECFFFPKSITGAQIMKEFKKRTRSLPA